MSISYGSILFYGINCDEWHGAALEPMRMGIETKVVNGIRIECVTHGTDSYPRVAIAISKSVVMADMHDVAMVTKVILRHNSKWDSALREFCVENNVEFSKPEWLLVNWVA